MSFLLSECSETSYISDFEDDCNSHEFDRQFDQTVSTNLFTISFCPEQLDMTGKLMSDMVAVNISGYICKWKCVCN